MQAASDSLGELPPGFTALHGQLEQPQALLSVSKKSPDQASHDVPPGYDVGQPTGGRPTVSSLAGMLLSACIYISLTLVLAMCVADHQDATNT